MGYNKKFLMYCFLHSLVFWVLSVTLSTANYMLGVYKVGSYFITHEDGTPVTGLQYFMMYNISWMPILTCLIVAFLIEYSYKCSVYGLEWNLKTAISKSSFSVALLALYYYWVLIDVERRSYSLGAILGIALTFTIYFFAYAFIRFTIENKERAAQLRQQQTQAELNALKAQLNPHFFFNTLNNLYGTALQENAPRTVGMIEQLSSIMRYMMSEGQQDMTDVKQELDFIENYWALQHIRLPEKKDIQVSKHIEYDEKPTEIAPLLLIAFIENAFKYGISIDHPCKIDLNLEVKNQNLTMVISNIIQKNNTLEKSNGIGIENAQKRLDLLYANKYTLAQTQNNDVYKVTLNLKLS